MSTKKDQTTVSTEGISIGQFPFSAKEKKELKEIFAAPYYNRRKLKDAFIERNSRIKREIEDYVAQNGKLKGKLKGTKKKKEKQERKVVSEPKPRIMQKQKGGEPARSRGHENSTAELRVGIRSLRIEGNILIIGIDQ